jgi:hypothetical protein
MLSLGAVSLAGGLYGALAGMLSVDLGRADATAPDNLPGLGAVHVEE